MSRNMLAYLTEPNLQLLHGGSFKRDGGLQGSTRCTLNQRVMGVTHQIILSIPVLVFYFYASHDHHHVMKLILLTGSHKPVRNAASSQASSRRKHSESCQTVYSFCIAACMNG
jgi:hypothetical protein